MDSLPAWKPDISSHRTTQDGAPSYKLVYKPHEYVIKFTQIVNPINIH